MEGKFGKNLLDPTKVIMEVKVPEERPEWLVALLEKYQIEKQSFSKYGNAYKLAHNIPGESKPTCSCLIVSFQRPIAILP